MTRTFEAAWSAGESLTADEAIAYTSRARGERKRPSSGWASLTPTEVEVVKLTATGLNNPEIGARLFIGRATVKTHLAHIFTKLGVTSRAELAAGPPVGACVTLTGGDTGEPWHRYGCHRPSGRLPGSGEPIAQVVHGLKEDRQHDARHDDPSQQAEPLRGEIPARYVDGKAGAQVSSFAFRRIQECVPIRIDARTGGDEHDADGHDDEGRRHRERLSREDRPPAPAYQCGDEGRAATAAT